MATKRTATNVTRSVAMPPALDAALSIEARHRKTTPSALVRIAVAEFLGLGHDATEMGTAGRPRGPNSKLGEPLKAIDALRSLPCQRCGWDSGPRDLHRIDPGKNGGKYVTGNIYVLCPNCHRMTTLGLLSDEALEAECGPPSRKIEIDD